MAEEFKRVGEDFRLHDEVLVVVNDIEESTTGDDPEPVALVFYRDPGSYDRVLEHGPDAVEDALSFAVEQGASTARQVVVQLPESVTWWPHWGTLVD